MAVINLFYWDLNHIRRKVTFDTVIKAIGYIASGQVGPSQPTTNPGDELYSAGNDKVYAISVFPFGLYRDTSASPSGFFISYENGHNTLTINNNLIVADYRLISWDGTFDSGWLAGDDGGTSAYEFFALVEGKYTCLVRDRANPNNLQIGLGNVRAIFSASVSGTNITFPDGSDGSIIVSVLSGSGDYTITWYDATTEDLNNGESQQMASRTDLPEGLYNINVHDNIQNIDIALSITLTDPESDVKEETFFNVPKCQSIEFTHEQVPDNYTVFQNLDNVRYINQKLHTGFNVEYYAQKICSLDVRTMQWQSNYKQHKVELYDCEDNLIASLPSALKVKNINVESEYPIFIHDRGPGTNQSTIYFNSSVFPIPLKVGDTFGITDNADGFNGAYKIILIGLDTTNNSQYFVINKTFDAPVQPSEAVGQFFTSLVNFNVFEAIIDFSQYETGKEYYIKIYPIVTFGDQQITAISEPINLQNMHNGTNLVRFKNEDNAWDIDYSTGIEHLIRVESVLFNRNPKSIINTTRNTTGELFKIRALKQRGVLFELVKIPPYLHEKLSIAFDSDFVYINEVRYATDQAYSAPNYLFNYSLSDATIEIEQFGWMKTYNSHDLNGQLTPDGETVFDDSFDTTYN